MAKLVEILARELVEWKKNADGAVFSSKGGACYFFHGNKPAHDDYNWRATEGCFWFVGESDKLVLNADAPDDHATAIVTRAEWQAAVDALKAKEVVEWDGVGLPPVGLPVEWYSDNSTGWQEIVVLAYHRFDAWIQPKGKASMIVGNIDNFRPIRTPEQIAADERESAINGMLTHDALGGSRRGLAAALYDAGYRKQEPK